MNVIKTNRDRNKRGDSLEIAAEPVGIMPHNYFVYRLATAKRQNVPLDNTSGITSTRISSREFWEINKSRLKAYSGGGNDTTYQCPRQNTSSTSCQESTQHSERATLFLNNGKIPFINNKNVSNSKSFRDSFSHLYQNNSKSSSVLTTPKKTPRKTSRSTTYTSSRTSKTWKTTTSESVEKDSNLILALSEGRGQARGEIGIAALDTMYPRLILCQISDTQTYENTLIKINVLDPVEVILPHTFCDGATLSKLYTSIRDIFPTITLTRIHRRHFNDTKGLQQIKNVCASEFSSLEILFAHKFYALCAAAALLKYVEYKQSMIFLPKTLNIEYQGPHNSTIIDVGSAHRLELTKSCTGTASQNSLLGVVNHCRTRGGVRLLRANILEPPCSVENIVYRLQCVQEIAEKSELFHSLQSVLTKVNNADRLLALCMHIPQQDSLRAAEVQMNYILLLKNVLEQIPILSTVLENATSEFLCSVKQDLQNDQYTSIMKRILETIHDDAHLAKQYTTAHYQRCFAVKPGVNGLLDVARKTYSELIQDMIEMVQKVSENCGLPIALKFNAVRGFHMQLVSNNQRLYKECDLPEEFIQIQKRRRSLTFTTQELIHADERCNDVRNEIQMMSNVVIFKLLVDIRDNIGCLYKLCENLAYLDMLLSFAKLSTLPNFVLPKFGDKLDIKCSRHPILDIINATEPIANDIFCSKDFNFNIITGPNMSGKSIYIRQIILLQIMAQIGCYVPAQEATFRITDRIFTRLCFDDSIECNASTFVLEIREVQCILRTITPNSLVIMDELCRGTSSEEGTAVAWALCENLLQTNAFIFLTTHFMLLTKFQDIYTNVRNYHFEITEQKDSPSEFVYTHHLLPGPTLSDNYGIQLAAILGMPESIISKAHELIENPSVNKKSIIRVNFNIDEDRKYLELVQELKELAMNEQSTKESCLQLKYKLFPTMASCDELIAINEIIPGTFNSGNDQGSIYAFDTKSASKSTRTSPLIMPTYGKGSKELEADNTENEVESLFQGISDFGNTETLVVNMSSQEEIEDAEEESNNNNDNNNYYNDGNFITSQDEK